MDQNEDRGGLCSCQVQLIVFLGGDVDRLVQFRNTVQEQDYKADTDDNTGVYVTQ